MKQVKKIARFLMLILLITLAAIIPVPLPVFSKDNSPKFLLEQVDEKEEEPDEEGLEEIA